MPTYEIWWVRTCHTNQIGIHTYQRIVCLAISTILWRNFKIRKIPPGFKFVSLDVKLLFMNVSLERAINVTFLSAYTKTNK